MSDEPREPGGAAGAGGPEGPDGPDGPEGTDELEDRLHRLRERILALDEEIIRLIGERRDRVLEVGEVKGALGRPVLDPAREAAVVRRAAELSREMGVDEELTRDVIWRIVASAREAQEGRREWGPVEPPPDADA